MNIEWGFKKLDKGVYGVWMDFPRLSEERLDIGRIEKDGSKWSPYGPGKNTMWANERSRNMAAYALVRAYLLEKTKELRDKLPSYYTDNVVRDRDQCILTAEQANKVWDVLVKLWGANESNRDSFVFHATEKMTTGWSYFLTEWRCGWGKFRQGHHHFGVSQYAGDVTPWSEYIMAETGIALQALYEEFYGVKEAA